MKAMMVVSGTICDISYVDKDGDGNAPGYCQDCGRMIRA